MEQAFKKLEDQRYLSDASSAIGELMLDNQSKSLIIKFQTERFLVSASNNLEIKQYL